MTPEPLYVVACEAPLPLAEARARATQYVQEYSSPRVYIAEVIEIARPGPVTFTPYPEVQHG